MNRVFLVLKKATMKIVAFYLLFQLSIQPAVVMAAKTNKIKTNQDKQQQIQIKNKIEEVRKKVTSLLLLKQRAQALDVVEQLRSDLQNTENELAIQALKLVVLTSFLSLETQDFFELASAQAINQEKSALKNIQKCLNLEPDHFMCLWAEAKIYKGHSENKYQQSVEKIKHISNLNSIPELQTLVASLDKNNPDFLNLKINFGLKTDLYNVKIIHLILEFDRSIRVKNYSLAKETLVKLQQLAPDYIDLVIMKSRLEQMSEEDYSQKKAAINTVYKKRCEAVTADIVRKYFFDIDFCKRSIE